MTAASPGPTSDDPIAEEQAALRRVATLVRTGQPARIDYSGVSRHGPTPEGLT